MLAIGLLGDMRILRDGAPIALPRSRKTRALLAFLATTGAAHRREQLGALLWDDTDDPRASLRWSLTQIRALRGRAERPLVMADSDTVWFDPRSATVDLTTVRDLLAARATTAQLVQAAGLFRGSFLDGLDLPDNHTFRSWRVAEREDARRAHILLLSQLVDRLATTPEAALTYARAWVTVDPHSELAWSRLVYLLFAVGRPSEARQQYQTALRAVRAAGGPSGPLLKVWRAATAPVAAHSAPPAVAPAYDHEPVGIAAPAPAANQEIRFCTAHDGVQIAYARTGVGSPLLRAANWTTHLGHDGQSPLWGHWIRELARDRQVVHFDHRANGLSDWDVPDLSFEALVSDLEAVVDAVDVPRFPLLATSQGCAIAAAYAARHPERISRLILYGGFAQGWKSRDPEDVARREAIGVLLQHGWGHDDRAVRQLFTSLLIPDASAAQMQHFNALQSRTISPANLARIHEIFSKHDIRGLLPRVRCPTLVLHCRHDSFTPFVEGQRFAAAIAGARFVAIDSRNHILLEDEPGWLRFLAVVRRFLAEDDP
ncbi:MAG TPA: alpha/beta fold hydrolase [Vineibacter sp.]|nr:alpha/beta fold hydrolase [Vineibacter sp.]